MAEKYRISVHGSKFTINHHNGDTVTVYKTQQEALQEIGSCEKDDFILELARDLTATAVKELMRIPKLDSQTAHDWIREAAD